MRGSFFKRSGEGITMRRYWIMVLISAALAIGCHAHCDGETFGLGPDKICLTIDGVQYCFASQAEADAFLAARFSPVSFFRTVERSVNRSGDLFGLGSSREVSASRSVEMFGLGAEGKIFHSHDLSYQQTSPVYQKAAEPIFQRSVSVNRSAAPRQPVRRIIRNEGPLRGLFQRLFGRRGARSYSRQSSYSYSGGTAARWTWPGGTQSSLADHLSDWPHYTDASGMSYSQMQGLHDRHHDQIGPVSAAQLRANRSRSVQVVRGGSP